MHRPFTSRPHRPALASDRWDRVGMGLSGLCLVHCLALPLLSLGLPLWAAADSLHAWMHPLLALGVLPVALLALRTCWRRHGAWHVPILLGSGLVVVVVALLAGHWLGPLAETAGTVLGSGLLLAGHWRNRCCIAGDPDPGASVSSPVPSRPADS